MIAFFCLKKFIIMSVNRKIPPKYNLVQEFRTPNIIKEKLNDKIDAFFINSTNSKISEINFLFNKGVWHQKHLLVANFTSKLIIEGTKKHNSKEIAELLDYYGANFDNNAGMHFSSFRITALNKFLPQLIKLIYEILSYPLFSRKEFEIKKQNLKKKYLINLQEVDIIARNYFEQSLFGKNHPYGWAAKPEDYDNLELSFIKKYFEKNYIAENLSIIVVTKEKQKIKSLLKQNFSSFRSSKIKPSKKKYQINSLKRNISIYKKDSFQAAIRVGWKLFDRKHSDYTDMFILNSLIGGYFGSRLMQNIRQKLGLTYSIFSTLKCFKYDGSFQIISEVNKENKNIVRDEIIKEIENLKNNRISQKELENLRNYLMGAILNSLDGNFKYARSLMAFIIYDIDFDYYNFFAQRVKQITPYRLNELSQIYFDFDKIFTTIVG